MQPTSRTLRAVALVASVSLAAACAGDATAPIQPASSSSSAIDLSASGLSTARNAARIRLIATLAPVAGGSFQRASGKAKWDSRNINAQRELEMEVEDVRAGTMVQFFVNGVRYGSTATVDALGNAHINLSTQLGATVPTSAAGLSAEVRTVGGTVIVSGVFPKS